MYHFLEHPVYNTLKFLNTNMFINTTLSGRDLLKFHAFANAIKMCDAVLKPYDISVANIFMKMDARFNESALHNFVGTIAFQVLHF